MKVCTTHGIVDVEFYTVFHNYAWAVVKLEGEGYKVIRGNAQNTVERPGNLAQFATWREAVMQSHDVRARAGVMPIPEAHEWDKHYIRQEEFIHAIEALNQQVGGLVGTARRMGGIIGGLDSVQEMKASAVESGSRDILNLMPLFGLQHHMIEEIEFIE